MLKILGLLLLDSFKTWNYVYLSRKDDWCLLLIGIGDSLCEWNILEREEKQQKINQLIIKTRVSVLQYFDEIIALKAYLYFYTWVNEKTRIRKHNHDRYSRMFYKSHHCVVHKNSKMLLMNCWSNRHSAFYRWETFREYIQIQPPFHGWNIADKA